MTDTPGGADWWQASDGKWYPAHTHPDYRPPQPAGSAGVPYGAPPYGSPPYAPPFGYGGYQPQPQTSSKATAGLVLAVLSFVMCPVVAAIAALVLAAQGSKEIRESNGQRTGEGLVTAARIVAIANLALSALAIGGLVLAVMAFDDEMAEFGRGVGDGFVQTELEDALRSQQQFREQHGRYTDDPVDLAQMGASIRLVPGTQPIDQGVVVVAAGERGVILGARSPSGACFYLRNELGATTYAEDDFCGDFASQMFTDSW